MAHRFARALFLGATSAATVGSTPVAWALLNPKDPIVTLYERPPEGAAKPAPAAEKLPELKQDAAGYWVVDFRHLASFWFGRREADVEPRPGDDPRPDGSFPKPAESGVLAMPTEPGQSGSIPPGIAALDGKRVRLSGYMLPIRMENGLVKDFLVLRNQMMCCFGRRPQPNEWVVVKMKGRGVPSTMDTPLCFYGVLHVGEIFENHVFEGLYQLDGEKIAAP